MIGRNRERKILMEMAAAKESQLAVVYGRRRVGKTYLVHETFADAFAFTHVGVENGTLQDELYAFWDSLRDFGWTCTRPQNWFDAFAELKRYLEQCPPGRKIVFLDELPWMDTRKSNFLKGLEKFWNGWATGRKDILLVVCGSAASWMTKNVLQNRGGLFNRASRQLYVLPFTLHECEELVKERGLRMDRADILSAYMVLGGAAYYWSLFDAGESLAQNIDRLFFSRTGELANEYSRLYRSVFANPEPYMAVVTALGMKKCGMTRDELVEMGEGIVNNGNLTACLANLEISGFLRKYAVPGHHTRGVIYQLIDNYTLFYFKFVRQNLGKDERFWSHNTTSPVRRAWEGLAFERVCLEHVSGIKRALGILGVETSVYAWRSAGKGSEAHGAQIDLVIDRADRVVNICEMKHSLGEYELTAEEARKLRNRVDAYRREFDFKGNVHLTLVTSGGFSGNKHSGIVQSAVTLDDLFAET